MNALIFAVLLLTAQEPATELPARFGSRGVRLHDPSTIVKDNGEFWLFYTGHGTPSYRSHDLITWTPGPRIFTNSPAWIAETGRGLVPSSNSCRSKAKECVDRGGLVCSLLRFSPLCGSVGFCLGQEVSLYPEVTGLRQGLS